MGKVKSWAWDCAEEQVDDIIKSVKLGKITKEQAIRMLDKMLSKRDNSTAKMTGYTPKLYAVSPWKEEVNE